MACRTHLCARHVAHVRSHATQINEACHTHTETSQFQHINESRHTNERVMSHRIRGRSGSRVMRMNRPLLLRISFAKEPYIYHHPRSLLQKIPTSCSRVKGMTETFLFYVPVVKKPCKLPGLSCKRAIQMAQR